MESFGELDLYLGSANNDGGKFLKSDETKTFVLNST